MTDHKTVVKFIATNAAIDKSPSYIAALDTLRKGAPGLSEQMCAVLARHIAVKVETQARTKLEEIRNAVSGAEIALCRDEDLDAGAKLVIRARALLDEALK